MGRQLTIGTRSIEIVKTAPVATFRRPTHSSWESIGNTDYHSYKGYGVTTIV